MSESFILFQVAETNYAVRSTQVQQMEMIENITRVPNAPSFVEGVVFLRGQVVPVINLRRRFGFDKAPYDIRSRLIVTNMSGRVVGLAVDSAREFVAIDAEQILPPPDQFIGTDGDYLEGVVSQAERLVLVLDLRKVLSTREKEVLAA